MDKRTEADIAQFVLPGTGQSFKGNDFRDLRQPGVYVFLLKGKPLYVGMSKQLLGRIGSRHSQAKRAIEDCDQVLLYPCINVEAAKQLEIILIDKLEPADNVNGRYKAKEKLLGLRALESYWKRKRAISHVSHALEDQLTNCVTVTNNAL